MNVIVAGGHGQIALKLLGLLAERGDRARGLIRNPAHSADLEAVGAEAVMCDMEAEDERILALNLLHPDRVGLVDEVPSEVRQQVSQCSGS